MTDIYLSGGITKKKSSMGIGNRLGGLISGIRFSIFYNCDFYIDWEPIPSLYLNYSDLIESIDLGTRRVLINQKNPQKKYLHKTKWRIDPLPSELDLPFFKNNEHITCKYNEISSEILESIIQSIKCINFNSSLTHQVDFFLESRFFLDKTIVGVSVRSWPDSSIRRKNYSIEHYINRMEKYNSSYIFFVSGDSQIEINKLKKKFSNRVVEFPRTTLRERVTNHKQTHLEDFIDFLILSKCQVLIGHFLSSYIEMAWFCGHCQSKLNLVYEPFNDDMRKKMPHINWDC